MNQKAARVSTGEIFKQKMISFEQLPHQSALFLDFLKNSANLDRFYPEKKAAPEQFAKKVLENYRTDRRALCDALTKINRSCGAGEKTFANIELLRQTDCAAIVTGQQAGLFSGAMYTIYKALSAVKFAADLKKRNVKAVPVFWIAEEDHDFEEIRKTFLLDKKGKLIAAQNTPQNLVEHAPVGLIALDETIGETLEDLFAQLPLTEHTAELKNLLSEFYRAGETFSTSFAKLIAKIFAEYGLIILTPLDADLKKLCAPIFAEAVEKSAAITSAVLERNAELEKENYQLQVLVEKDSFPFFIHNEKGERLALRRNLANGKIRIQKSDIEFEVEELLKIARTAPQNLSPNALLRSVVQDYLLPTLRYFGGAAEIAYFAQNSAIYETLDRPVTPIVHRASLTVIEPRPARTLRKYEIDFTDLFGGKESVQAKIVERFLNQTTARVFSEVEENINRQLNLLAENLNVNEPTLADNLVNRRKKILWHVAALRKKYHRAEILKNEVAANRVECLFTSLLPHHALQERTLNAVTFLNLYGANFVEWIYEAIEADETEHRILYL